MKKLFYGVLVAFSLMLTGCGFFIEGLSASVTVVNNTNKDIYCFADYNSSTLTDSKVHVIEADSTSKFETGKGLLSQVLLENEAEDCFSFFYCTSEEWQEQWDSNGYEPTVFDLMTFGISLEEEAKYSQNYKVTLNLDEEDEIVAVLTWE